MGLNGGSNYRRTGLSALPAPFVFLHNEWLVSLRLMGFFVCKVSLEISGPGPRFKEWPLRTITRNCFRDR